MEPFRTTHWSVVLAVRPGNSDDEGRAALNELCQVYWRPLYLCLRQMGFDSHDAADLTQQFFAEILARNGFHNLAPERGRFRSFLLASLKNFLSHQRERNSAKKRGGGRPILSLNDSACTWIQDLEDPAHEAPDTAFDRHWARTILHEARNRLAGEYAAQGKSVLFKAIAGYLPGGDLPESQAEVAARLDTTPTAIKSEIYRMRQRFGQHLRAEVARTLADPGDIDIELSHLIAMFRS